MGVAPTSRKKPSITYWLEAVFWPPIALDAKNASLWEFAIRVCAVWRGLVTGSLIILIGGFLAAANPKLQTLLFWLAGGVAASSLIASFYRMWAVERRRVLELEPPVTVEDLPVLTGELVELVIGTTADGKWRGYIHLYLTNSGPQSIVQGFIAGFRSSTDSGYRESNYAVQSQVEAKAIWLDGLSSQLSEDITFIDGENPTKTISRGDHLNGWIVFDQKPMQGLFRRVADQGEVSHIVDAPRLRLQLYYSDYKKRKWTTSCILPQGPSKIIAAGDFVGSRYVFDRSKSRTELIEQVQFGVSTT